MSRARPGSLRVVAGTAGGLRLEAPPGSGTRPTADRVRQAVFNALDSIDAVEAATVLDPFAGSGALAIEALSRGAASATLCETSAAARQVVEANLVATGLADRARVVAGPGERAVATGGPWDLVLLDPPYDYAGWDTLLAELVPRLSERAVVVVESDREVPVEPHLRVIRSKRYGGTVVLFAVPPGAPS